MGSRPKPSPTGGIGIASPGDLKPHQAIHPIGGLAAPSAIWWIDAASAARGRCKEGNPPRMRARRVRTPGSKRHVDFTASSWHWLRALRVPKGGDGWMNHEPPPKATPAFPTFFWTSG